MKIAPNILHDLLEKENSRLVIDVLPEDAFAARHIPGAVNACVYEVVFLETVENATAGDRSKALVVYDETDTFETANLAAERLAAAGYTDVAVLEGGMRAWTEAGFPADTDGAAQAGMDDGAYPLDLETSVIEWTGRNIANKHWGNLKLSSGEVTVKNGAIAGGRVVIDMNTIACDDIPDADSNAMLVAHLKSADFFETETWPEAVLEVTGAAPIESPSDGVPNTKLTADLTLCGETHGIEFPCLIGRSPDGDVVAQGNFDFDRTRWNIRYGSGRFFEWLGKHIVNDLISLQIKMTIAKDALKAR